MTAIRSSGHVHQINVSKGGVPKLPVHDSFVGTLGLDGDSHNDKENHGGPDRAVCLYSLELIDSLRSEGHPIVPGTAGENITVCGLEWTELVPGVQLRLGESVLLEITSYTTPCRNIAKSFSDGRFSRISQKTHPGESRVYARVLTTGVVRTGDPVEVLSVATQDIR